MASSMATARLRKEYVALQKKPVENIRAAPLEKNILEWYYVINGTDGTPYEGGYYFGKLKFPAEYPMKPPSVLMLTPSGRFEINRRICLSMSDFHPETWNPLWSVSSILTGLYSFMLENEITTGGIETSDDEKRALAKTSLATNCEDKIFRSLFPDLVELHNSTKQLTDETSHTMASAMAIKRLRKEYIALQKKPVDYIQALPLETNILEWHYVITGTPGTPYEGGYYHGVLKFPPEYPMKPPAVKMITPNGRFMTDKRLCLSMSDFHPETWNPMWSVSSILTGLYSFMIENQPTLGSIVTTDAQKRKYAAQSLETNCNNPLFRKLFPDLVEIHHKQIAEREAALRSAQAAEDGAPSASSNVSAAILPGGSNGAATLANVVAKDKDFLQNQAFVVYGGIGVLLLAVAVLYLFS